MLIVVTGVARSGKTTIGSELGRRLALPFLDVTALSTLSDEERARLSAGNLVISLASTSGEEDAQLSTMRPQLRVVLKLSRAEAERRVQPSGSELTEFKLPSEPPGALVIPANLAPTEIVERVLRRLIALGHPAGHRLHFAEGSRYSVIDSQRAGELLDELLERLGPMRRVLLVPPDFTRFHSGAGALTSMLYARLAGKATVEVLPALGTHAPMTEAEISEMFPGVPSSCFRVHEWRHGLSMLGEVPSSYVREVSRGLLDYSIRCEVDARLTAGWDRIISIGQLVPHEVIGIAGHDKNIFVGTGGKDVIDRTHYLGAVCGMESIMGRAQSPVRDVLRYMAGSLASHLPITHLVSVRERMANGEMQTRGLFAGDDYACFAAGAPLVQACNLELFEKPLKKVVVYLDPSEFKSTWLGNKSVYRTRMVLADAGELLVLAPGVHRFGEDQGIDKLIRRHGYHGTPRTLEAVAADPELGNSLSAAAHLIHGSSEGRFSITYAAGGLSKQETEGVGYQYRDADEAMRRYDPTKLKAGMNTMPDGEEIFFVPNPAVGLWGLRSQFAD
ncbi:MAG: lactate racemase domain-containing protein [Polyangiaceae bacterium]